MRSTAYPASSAAPQANAAPGPSPFAVRLYSDPATAIRRVKVAMHAPTARATAVASTNDQTVAVPAVAATIAGTVAIPAAGAAVDTDCASTSRGRRLRRSRPCTGERCRSPASAPFHITHLR
jgi:hypothetical protein